MQNTESNISEQSVKKLLTRVNSETVDIYPGWSLGKSASVSFMVFSPKKETPLFEISLSTRGRILYKDNERFANPPLFDELFKTILTMHEQRVINSHNFAEMQNYCVQTLILANFAIHKKFQR